MASETDNKVAIAALLRGKGCANSLKALFKNRETSSISMESLIDTILDSFSIALSLMDVPNPLLQHESSSQNMVPRRSLKKQICGQEFTKHYIVDTPSPLLNDGFSWRKYGQKTIKNSPHQRSYYRCTYAKDQNCNATKQVQKIQDNPPIHRTNYVGQHMCNATAFTIFSDIDDANGSKMFQLDKYDHVMTEPVMHQLASNDHPDKYDHVMSEPVIPQLASNDHPEIRMEDKATDQIMNQECDVSDYFVDDDQLWAYQFPPFSSEDFMFLENFTGFD